MSLKTIVLGAIGAASLALGASAATAATPPIATIASNCSVGSGEGYGYAYLTSLVVKRTTCATGKELVRHKGKVSGWHCSKKILQRSPIQYDARMSCSRGSKRVTYVYTQNT